MNTEEKIHVKNYTAAEIHDYVDNLINEIKETLFTLEKHHSRYQYGVCIATLNDLNASMTDIMQTLNMLNGRMQMLNTFTEGD